MSELIIFPILILLIALTYLLLEKKYKIQTLIYNLFILNIFIYFLILENYFASIIILFTSILNDIVIRKKDCHKNNGYLKPRKYILITLLASTLAFFGYKIKNTQIMIIKYQENTDVFKVIEGSIYLILFIVLFLAAEMYERKKWK